MRYPVIIAGLAASLLAGPVMAAGIAIVDSSAVLAASDAAKKAADKYEAATKVQRERIETLKAELQALEAKYKKDGAIMSEADKKALQKQGEDKAGEFQRLGQAVGEAKQRAERELQSALVPKVNAIIEDLRKAGKYDVVLERQAGVRAFDPSLDLTRKVIERINAPAAAK